MNMKHAKVALAFDHVIEHGYRDFKGIDISPEHLANIANNLDGIMGHIGLIREVAGMVKGVKVVKLTGKSEGRQKLVTLVDEAAEIADAVGFTVYFNPEMEFEYLDEVKYAAREYGLPVIGFMYPRGKWKTEWKVVEAARVGCELGFDYVKTYYLSKRGFENVAKYAFRPVFAAGGEKHDWKNVVAQAKHVASLGERMMIGRNIWQRTDAEKRAKEIRSILHD